MCSLVSGVENQSENIKVRSVVGRYLEHSRVFIFGDAKKEQQVFIGSGDWMARNLDKRVEVVAPIFDTKLKAQLNLFLETMWKGNQKARIIDALQKNEYVRSDSESIEAQLAIYDFYKELSQEEYLVPPSETTN